MKIKITLFLGMVLLAVSVYSCVLGGGAVLWAVR